MENHKKQLVDAARCGLQWLDDVSAKPYTQTRKHQSLRLIFNEVIRTDGEKSVFTSDDTLCDAHDYDAGSSARKAFPKLGEALEYAAEALSQMAVDTGLAVYPSGSVKKEGNRNVFELTTEPAGNFATVTKADIPQGAVRYTIVSRRELPRWQQWLMNREMGFGAHLLLSLAFLLIPAAVVVFDVIFIVQLLHTPTVFYLSVFVGLVWVEWGMLRGLYELFKFPERKIVMVHEVLLNFKQAPTAMVMRRLNNKDWPILQLITPQATCPLCDGTIYIRKDTSRRYRIIGACNRHPTEHRYSFDYTVNLGWRIND